MIRQASHWPQAWRELWKLGRVLAGSSCTLHVVIALNCTCWNPIPTSFFSLASISNGECDAVKRKRLGLLPIFKNIQSRPRPQDIFRKPVEGAKNDGAKGCIVGCGTGLAGLSLAA